MTPSIEGPDDHIPQVDNKVGQLISFVGLFNPSLHSVSLICVLNLTDRFVVLE